jgi:hypothetical protein
MSGELPRISEDLYPKANKEHKCCECDRIINVGEKYHLCKGNWEGKWLKFKTCYECNELRHELQYDNEFAPFGNLYEWAGEAGIEFPVK